MQYVFFITPHSEIVLRERQALKAGLSVILCVGETLEEREANKTAAVVESQLVEVINVIGKDAAQWEYVSF